MGGEDLYSHLSSRAERGSERRRSRPRWSPRSRGISGIAAAFVLLATTATLAQASSSEPPTGQPEAGALGGSDTSQPSATNTD